MPFCAAHAEARGLGACFARSAPLPLRLFGEEEGAELGNAPLPALDGLPAWSSAPWPTQPADAELMPAEVPAGNEGREEQLSSPVQEAAAGASTPAAAADSSIDNSAHEKRPAFEAAVSCTPAAPAFVASSVLVAAANGHADDGSWPDSPAWAAADSPSEPAVPAACWPSQPEASAVSAANGHEGTSSPAWHAADSPNGFAAWEGAACGGAAGNGSLQHHPAAAAEPAVGLKPLQMTSGAGRAPASAETDAQRASCKAGSLRETFGRLVQSGSGHAPLANDGAVQEASEASISVECGSGSLHMGTAAETERPGERYWGAWVLLLQVGASSMPDVPHFT